MEWVERVERVPFGLAYSEDTAADARRFNCGGGGVGLEANRWLRHALGKWFGPTGKTGGTYDSTDRPVDRSAGEH